MLQSRARQVAVAKATATYVTMSLTRATATTGISTRSSVQPSAMALLSSTSQSVSPSHYKHPSIFLLNASGGHRQFAGSATSNKSQSPPPSKPLGALPQPMLVRDFIRDTLYSKSSGYFVATDCVFHSPPVPFNKLVGVAQYQQRVAEIYDMTKDGWVTPVELFKPYYGHALARWVLSHLLPNIYSPRGAPSVEWADIPGPFALSQSPAPRPLPQLGAASISTMLAPPFPLRIVEIGGGKGACALDILNYLEVFAPSVYATCKYTVYELSPFLSQKQTELIRPLHGDHFESIVADAIEITPEQARRASTSDIKFGPNKRIINAKKDNTRASGAAAANANATTAANASAANAVVGEEQLPVFVIGLEVIDNMPHDKVVRGDDGVLYQVVVENNNNNSTGSSSSSDGGGGGVADHLLNLTQQARSSPYREVAAPLQDPLLRECVELWNEFHGSHSDAKDVDSAASSAGAGAGAGADALSMWSKLNPWRWAKEAFMLRKIKPRRSAEDIAKASVMYVPTDTMRFLKNLGKVFPKHQLLLADFDVLDSNEPGRPVNSPTVANRVATGSASATTSTQDMDTYLAARGAAADVFFPTDFAFLSFMYRRVVGGAVSAEEGMRREPTRTSTATALVDQCTALGTVPGKWEPKVVSSRTSPPVVSTDVLTNDRNSKGNPLVDRRRLQSMETKELERRAATVDHEGEDVDVTVGEAAADGQTNLSARWRRAVESVTSLPRLWKSGDFLARYADVTATTTRTGYNPLLQDYVNMSIFVGSSRVSSPSTSTSTSTTPTTTTTTKVGAKEEI